MDILFVTEAIIYSDISYRLRVMNLMREATRSARVSLFVFGVAPLEGRSGIDDEILANGITLKRAICLAPLPGMRLLEYLFVAFLSWCYLTPLLLSRRAYKVIQVENLIASLSILPFFFIHKRFFVVLDYHGVVPEEVKLKRTGWSRCRFPVLKWLERNGVAFADGRVRPSERLRDHGVASFGFGADSMVVYSNRM